MIVAYVTGNASTGRSSSSSAYTSAKDSTVGVFCVLLRGLISNLLSASAMILFSDLFVIKNSTCRWRELSPNTGLSKNVEKLLSSALISSYVLEFLMFIYNKNL